VPVARMRFAALRFVLIFGMAFPSPCGGA
jgi:hypothetical protein